MLAEFHYPGFIGSYESRTCNPYPMYHQTYGTSFHGTKATLIVNRAGYWIVPNEKGAKAVEETRGEWKKMNEPHWANFVECIRSREKPTSDIETCVRTTTTCLLANISMRFGTRLDWDEKNWTVSQADARKHLKLNYRKTWKLEG
jgi:predicted dehydrogenase